MHVHHLGDTLDPHLIELVLHHQGNSQSWVPAHPTRCGSLLQQQMAFHDLGSFSRWVVNYNLCHSLSWMTLEDLQAQGEQWQAVVFSAHFAKWSQARLKN